MEIKMVKHIILWKLKEGLDKEECKACAKSRLEALNGKIDGLIKLEVITCGLDSSSADMLLNSEFESEDALAGYQKNPLHLEAAGYVRSVVGERLCLDFNK